jgi:hypothetical protein
MSRSPDYVVLCVLACLAEMPRRQVLAASLGGKYLRRVNAIAIASTWMVRYAISSNIFQEKMSELMESLEFVRAYLDDLLCISKLRLEDHLDKLEVVLRRLRDAGLKVNAAKLTFCALEIEYLGYVLTRDGIHLLRVGWRNLPRFAWAGGTGKKSSSRLSGGCAIAITTRKKRNSSRLSGGCTIVITTGKKSSSRLSGGCAIIITTGKKSVLVVCLAGA